MMQGRAVQVGVSSVGIRVLFSQAHLQRGTKKVQADCDVQNWNRRRDDDDKAGKLVFSARAKD